MNAELYDYDIFYDKCIGSGSFSHVYLGKCKNAAIIKKYSLEEKFVAIKKIEIKKLSSSTKHIVSTEIEIMRSICADPHPNIVQCYDIIENIANKCAYIVMEYCDSGDLASLIKKPIKEKFVQFYFSQLTNGLRYLFDHNIIHRDIKPLNILLTNNKKILKIADFGFAKRKIENSLYDTICGSPLYMAPEIVSRQLYNEQTDLWSVGIILYEMLFGVNPFNNCKRMVDLIESINDEIEIPPSSTINIDVSEECLVFLRLLLQKDVRRRITLDDYFEHSWVNKYKYNTTSSTEYSSQLNLMSVRSLTPENYNKFLPHTSPVLQSSSVSQMEQGLQRQNSFDSSKFIKSQSNKIPINTLLKKDNFSDFSDSSDEDDANDAYLSICKEIRNDNIKKITTQNEIPQTHSSSSKTILESINISDSNLIGVFLDKSTNTPVEWEINDGQNILNKNNAIVSNLDSIFDSGTDKHKKNQNDKETDNNFTNDLIDERFVRNRTKPIPIKRKSNRDMSDKW